MRAWAVVENGKPLKEIELPTPEPTGTEVLLETTYCGVCHSDLHIWDGHYDLGGGKTMNLKDRGVVLPLAMGHEIVGRVVKLGPDATGVKVGDLRIVYPWVGCGKCAACLSDEDNMCLTPRSLGVYQNGGYATPRPRAASAPSRRSRHDRSGSGRDLRLFGHHGATRRSRRSCRCRPTSRSCSWARADWAERGRILQGDGAPQHRRRRHQRRRSDEAALRRPARPRWSTARARGRHSASSRRPAVRCGRSSISSTAQRPRASPSTRCARAASCAGRAVRRRADAAAADHGDPRADRSGQLRRHGEGSARTGGTGAGRQAEAVAGPDRAASARPTTR